MPKLVIKKGSQVVKKLAVPDEMEAFTVGCERGNDIIINDEVISFFHLQFEQQNGQYYVRDLQSQWGTFVNGHKISQRTPLHDYDEVKLGKHTIVFLGSETGPGIELPVVGVTPAAQPARPVRSTSSPQGPRPNIAERMVGVPSLVQLNDWLATNREPPATQLKLSSWHTENGATTSRSGQPGMSDHPATSHAEQYPASHTSGQKGANGYGHPDGVLDLKEQPGPGYPDGGTSLADAAAEDFLIGGDLVPETLEPEGTNSGITVDLYTDTEKPEEAVTGSPLETQAAYLLGIYGYYLGRKFKIKEPETRIGRDRKLNDIVLKKNSRGKFDQSISRRHATLRFKNNRWYLSDKRSKSRTWLNQRMLEINHEVQIRAGDEIEIKSDGKSHILRMVEEGDWDYSFPRKAGGWTVRYRLPLFNAVSALLILLALVVFGESFANRRLITSRPSELQLSEAVWGASDIDSKFEPRERVSFAIHPAIADVNGDETVDLIYVNNKGLLNCINGRSKDPLWTNYDFKAIQEFPVVVEDLYGKGLPDLVVISTDDRVHAIDGKWGLEIWKSPILAGPLTGPPVVADFNGDGLKDVAVASVENAVYIGLSNLGTLRWVKMDLQVPVLSIISVADRTGDGLTTLLIGTETGKVLLIDAVEQKITKELNVNEELNKAIGSFDQNNQVRGPVAVADLDGDTLPDLAIHSEQGNILALDGASLHRMWYSLNDSLATEAGAGSQGIVLGDLDGDNLADVVSQTSAGRLIALEGTGAGRDRKMVWWEFRTPSNDLFIGQPILADFDKNGTLDVLVTGQRGTLYILDGATGRTLITHPAGESKLVSQPLIGDLDNDHTLDILVLREDGRFYKLNSNSRTPERVVWGQAFGNSKHTNAASALKRNSGIYFAYMASALVAILLVVGLQFGVRRTRSKLSYY
ncbi:MAG: FHA domain-containing protein [bacterium]